MRALGVVAILCFVIHALAHLAGGHPWELLWACTLGALLVGIGALASRARVVAIGVCWLAFGNPLWMLDVAAGSTLMPTSLLTHIVTFVIGWVYLTRRGFPRGTFWRAWLLSIALLFVVRVASPTTTNVNLVHRVPPGWEARFPNHAFYLALLLLGALAIFWGIERFASRWITPPFPVRPGEGPNASPRAGIG